MRFDLANITEEDTLVRLEERLRAHTERFAEVLTTVNSLAQQAAIMDQRLKANEMETSAFREAKHNINKFLHIHDYQMEGISKALNSLTESADKNKTSVAEQISILQRSVNSLQNWKYTVLGGCATIGGIGGVLTTLLSRYIEK